MLEQNASATRGPLRNSTIIHGNSNCDLCLSRVLLPMTSSVPAAPGQAVSRTPSPAPTVPLVAVTPLSKRDSRLCRPSGAPRTPLNMFPSDSGLLAIQDLGRLCTRQRGSLTSAVLAVSVRECRRGLPRAGGSGALDRQCAPQGEVGAKSPSLSRKEGNQPAPGPGEGSGSHLPSPGPTGTERGRAAFSAPGSAHGSRR